MRVFNYNISIDGSTCYYDRKGLMIVQTEHSNSSCARGTLNMTGKGLVDKTPNGVP
jgi:phosphosulfolactate phosphohydrolase-like enzyme